MVARHAPPPSPPPRARKPATPAAAEAEADAEPLARPPPPPRELIEGPTREDLVRRRAFDLYERNGRVDGRALDDWLTAEAEVGRMQLDGTAPLPDAGGAP